MSKDDKDSEIASEGEDNSDDDNDKSSGSDDENNDDNVGNHNDVDEENVDEENGDDLDENNTHIEGQPLNVCSKCGAQDLVLMARKDEEQHPSEYKGGDRRVCPSCKDVNEGPFCSSCLTHHLIHCQNLMPKNEIPYDEDCDICDEILDGDGEGDGEGDDYDYDDNFIDNRSEDEINKDVH